MELIWNNLPAIITFTIGFAIVWKYIGKVGTVIKETQELLTAIIVAFADQKITKEEIKTIIKEAKDIPMAIKNLIKKNSTP